MSATTFDSLLSQVVPFFQGAPNLLFTPAFVHSARELCRRSKCWNEWQDIVLLADDSNYAITAPAESSVRVVRSVISPSGRLLDPISNDDIAKNKSYLLGATGEPSAYVLKSDMSIQVYPKPTSAQSGLVVKAHVAFIPNTDATSLPADLIERFEEVLINGCKARMFEMPKMPWSDQQAAIYYKEQFQKGVSDAEIELLTDYGSGDLVVQKRRFG